MPGELAHIDPQPPAVVVDAEVLRYLGYDPNNVATRALVLLAHRYQLDPLLGEISLIRTGQGTQLYVTRDGMLAVAHRSGHLDGIVVDEQRRNTTDDGWTAYVSVWRNDMSHPFRYGAQCKDSETQARNGKGPEMALTRAERRALKRAFQIRTDFYPDQPHRESDDTEIVEAEVVEDTPGPALMERSNPDEFIVPSKEQSDELRRLLKLHQLDGRDATSRTNKLDAMTSMLGRTITNTNELSRGDVAVLIDGLKIGMPSEESEPEEAW